MTLHMLLTCSFMIIVHGQRFSKAIEGAQPRLGYSSSVVHSYPQTNDLHGESSVKVNFQPQQEIPVQSIPVRGTTKYLLPNHNPYTGNIFNNNQKNTPSSFNVGYNITFSDTSISSAKKRGPIYTRANPKKIENADVITGKSKRNEKVRAPSISLDLSPEEFVAHAFLKQKRMNSENIRHTSSPIYTKGRSNSPKYLNPIREHALEFPSQSPKFTYNTQQNIFSHGVKSTQPDPIQLNQEFKTSYQTNSRWKNVGSGLEISKSVEPQLVEQNYGKIHSAGYTNTKTLRSEPPQNFNHDSALKTSQSFDFSNAHGELLYEGKNAAIDNSAEGSEQYTQNTKFYEVNNYPQNQNNLESNINKQQFSDLSNINIEAHIPARLRGVKPLPIDTSLLKDAVLTTDFREIPKDPKIIPIRFDISNIQTAMQEQSAQLQNYAAQNIAQSNLNLSPPPQNTGSTYQDHESTASQNDFRMYGKHEPEDTHQYRMGLNYDRKHFDNDIYNIVSMRPPPVG